MNLDAGPSAFPSDSARDNRTTPSTRDFRDPTANAVNFLPTASNPGVATAPPSMVISRSNWVLAPRTRPDVFGSSALATSRDLVNTGTVALDSSSDQPLYVPFRFRNAAAAFWVSGGRDLMEATIASCALAACAELGPYCFTAVLYLSCAEDTSFSAVTWGSSAAPNAAAATAPAPMWAASGARLAAMGMAAGASEIKAPLSLDRPSADASLAALFASLIAFCASVELPVIAIRTALAIVPLLFSGSLGGPGQVIYLDQAHELSRLCQDLAREAVETVAQGQDQAGTSEGSGSGDRVSTASDTSGSGAVSPEV